MMKRSWEKQLDARIERIESSLSYFDVVIERAIVQRNAETGEIEIIKMIAR